MSKKWITRTDAMKLIGCQSHKTLRKYRQQYWTEGAHYQIINRNKILYNQDLIEHWLSNRHNPSAHLKMVTKYLKSA